MKKQILSLEDKKRLNQLFLYYKIKKELSWITIRECGISPTTFSSILNQEIKKTDEIYWKILNQLDKQFIHAEGFYEWFAEFLLKTKEALETKDEVQLQVLLEGWEKAIAPIRHYVIFEEYDFIIHCVFNRSLNEKMMSLDEMQSVLGLIECGFVDNEVSIYLLEYVFMSNESSFANSEIRRRLYQETSKRNDNVMIKRIYSLATS